MSHKGRDVRGTFAQAAALQLYTVCVCMQLVADSAVLEAISSISDMPSVNEELKEWMPVHSSA